MYTVYLHVHLAFMTFVKEPWALNPEILILVTINNPKLRISSCSKNSIDGDSPPSKYHWSITKRSVVTLFTKILDQI